MAMPSRFATLMAILAITFTNYIHITYNTVSASSIPSIILTNPVMVNAEDFLVKIDPQEFECMRANMYFEARNQKTDDAFVAVGYTVINRSQTKGYPESLCEVIKEKRFAKKKQRWVCQFSWFCDGKPDEPPLTLVVTQKINGKAVKKTVPNLAEQEAWDRAGELAIKVMRNEVDNPIGDATMYHATYVSPNWDFRKLKQVAKIETHIYYKIIKV